MTFPADLHRQQASKGPLPVGVGGREATVHGPLTALGAVIFFLLANVLRRAGGSKAQVGELDVVWLTLTASFLFNR